MVHIFSDCNIEVLETDESEPGVFMKAKKTRGGGQIDLSDYNLFAMEQPQQAFRQESKPLTFTLSQENQAVTITEEVVIKMYEKIQQSRRMRGEGNR